MRIGQERNGEGVKERIARVYERERESVVQENLAPASFWFTVNVRAAPDSLGVGTLGATSARPCAPLRRSSTL